MKRQIKLILILMIMMMILIVIMGNGILIEDTGLKNCEDAKEWMVGGRKEYKIIVDKANVLRIALTSKDFYLAFEDRIRTIEKKYDSFNSKRLVVLNGIEKLVLKWKAFLPGDKFGGKEVVIPLEEGTYYLRGNIQNEAHFTKYRFTMVKTGGKIAGRKNAG